MLSPDWFSCTIEVWSEIAACILAIRRTHTFARPRSIFFQYIHLLQPQQQAIEQFAHIGDQFDLAAVNALPGCF